MSRYKEDDEDFEDEEEEFEEKFEECLPSLNFREAIDTAKRLLKEQAVISRDPDSTLKEIELRKAKTSAFLDALGSAIEISHQAELIASDGLKFKRQAELEAMSPLLGSYTLASGASHQIMTWITNRLAHVLEQDIENIDVMQLVRMQEAYGVAVDNLNKLTNGVSKLIQTERQSGGRDWGSRRIGASQMQYLKGLSAEEEEGDYDAPKPRKLGKKELKSLVDAAAATEDDYFDDDD